MDIIKSTKPLINNIEFCGSNLAISKVNNKIIFYSENKKVRELSAESLCEDILMNDNMYGFLDKDKLVVYGNSGILLIDKNAENIVCSFLIGDLIYTIDSTGLLREWISGDEIELNMDVESARYMGGKIYCSSSGVINEYSLNGELQHTIDILDRITKYSGDGGMAFGENIRVNKKMKLESNADEVTDEVNDSDDITDEYNDSDELQINKV